jgi:hypothetical protein
MKQNNVSLPKIPVLVRAWGDEPVKLFLHRIANKRCFVGRQAGAKSLGLPSDQVFSYDLDRFISLSTAFKQGDVDKLGELWANIPVDDCACNRYQDNLECVHDQESVSSSGSTQERGGR